MDNLNYEPKMIVRHIEQTYQYTISYLKACRAKQRAFEMRFGTYEASYDNLSRMLSQVAARNSGSFYDTYLVPAVTRGQSILQRAFFCLGACVRAFQCCLPVICIDGTFLTGRYKRSDTHRNRGRLQQSNSSARICICWEWELRQLVLVPWTSEGSCCCCTSRCVPY